MNTIFEIDKYFMTFFFASKFIYFDMYLGVYISPCFVQLLLESNNTSFECHTFSGSPMGKVVLCSYIHMCCDMYTRRLAQAPMNLGKEASSRL